MKRRNFLRSLTGAAMIAFMEPFEVLAAIWNRAAFESTRLDEAVKGMGITAEIASADIAIVAPQFAENGAVVQIEVASRIAGTEAIAILVEKNPTPLIANFMFANGAEPFVVTRIKMAETSEVKVIVKAGSSYFTAGKKVEVSIGGCG